MSRAILDALKQMRIDLTTRTVDVGTGVATLGPLYGMTFRHTLDDDKGTVQPPLDGDDADPDALPDPRPATASPMSPARSELRLSNMGGSIHKVNVPFTVVETITMAAITDIGNAQASKIAEAMTSLLSGEFYVLFDSTGKLWRARIKRHQRTGPAVIRPAVEGRDRSLPGGSRQIELTWTGRATYREVG
jgi:hypothetical protein